MVPISCRGVIRQESRTCDNEIVVLELRRIGIKIPDQNSAKDDCPRFDILILVTVDCFLNHAGAKSDGVISLEISGAPRADIILTFPRIVGNRVIANWTSAF